MNVLIDSDVLVAHMDGTEDQSADCRVVIQAAVRGRFNGYVTPLIAANTMYALARKWKEEELPHWKEHLPKVMMQMLPTLGMLPVSRADFMDSYASIFKDKEDGIQYFAAVRSRAIAVIVTCNTRDFKLKEVPVMHPRTFADKHLK